MSVDTLRGDQWRRIEPFVPRGRKGRCGPRSNNRRFIDADTLIAPTPDLKRMWCQCS